VNWQHLTLIIWLRWRLSLNQWRRAGALNAFLTVSLVVAALTSAVLSFFVSLILGCVLLGETKPDDMMYLWDVLVVIFLVVWSIGVATELQRSEFLSLEKMLHFPISPSGAFLLNYLSSLISFAIILFVPTMVGLSIASVVTHGPAMLLLFPLVFGFLVIVTAVTYQFRGWMASLMKDKRRRRTILTIVTVLFVVMTQLPNLANLAYQQQRRERKQAEIAAEAELDRQEQSGEIDAEEHRRRKDELREARNSPQNRKFTGRLAQFSDKLLVVNMVVPLGWLPYGARAAALGNPVPGLLGSVGLMFLGAISLRSSHRATLRMYTGQTRVVKARRAVKPDAVRIESAPFMERTIAGCSEQVSAVALASVRHMMRAPEAKMALLSPLIMAIVFGSLIFFGPLSELPAVAHPFLSIAAISMSIFGSMQLMVNLFGADRGGFRAFVLSPIPRRDILVGKNLVIAPLALAMAMIVVVAAQFVAPLSAFHFAATVIQLVPAYLLVCLVGNMTSIFAPMAVAAGSMKPVQPKFVPILLQMMATMMVPAVLLPAVVALTIELLLDKFGGGRWFPLYLVISLVELPIAIFLYRYLVNKQGAMLLRREAKILEAVTAKAE